MRTDFPYGIYRYSSIPSPTHDSGDVYARAKLRALEIRNSIQFIFEQLDNLPAHKPKNSPKELAKNAFTIALIEGIAAKSPMSCSPTPTASSRKFIFRCIQVAPQLVGHSPEGGFEAEDGTVGSPAAVFGFSSRHTGLVGTRTGPFSADRLLEKLLGLLRIRQGSRVLACDR